MQGTLKVLSFGGGVQTTALAALCCTGKYRMPDIAVFADTQWETQETYNYIKMFKRWMENRGIKLSSVTNGNIRDDFIKKDGRCASMPLFMQPDHESKGKGGMLLRQCTNEYKITPVYREIRRLLGLKKGERNKGKAIELWFGISLDEVHRMRINKTKWIKNTYPLVEMRVTRQDCLNIIRSAGLPPPPKSACIGCPYRSNASWKHMKKTQPSDFADAVDFDRSIRDISRTKYKAFLHRSMKPLSEVYLDENQDDLFGVECEGHCGL